MQSNTNQSIVRRSWRGKRRGNTIVELALTLGILLNLTFGMVEFGYCFYCMQMLEGAAREGARAAITPSATNASVTTAAQAAMSAGNITSANYTVSITDTSNNAINVATVSTGSQIQVKVTATWGTIGNGFRPLGLMTSAKTIKGVCVMRKEG